MIVPPETGALLARPEFPALLTGLSCFSTLGCPELSLEETAALARRFHVPYLELRTLENRTDLPVLLAAFPGGWSGVRDYLHERDLSPRVLGTSFKLIGSSAAQWEELFAFARLAQDLEAPWLRVFGGGTWGTPSRPRTTRSRSRWCSVGGGRKRNMAGELTCWWRRMMPSLPLCPADSCSISSTNR